MAEEGKLLGTLFGGGGGINLVRCLGHSFFLVSHVVHNYCFFALHISWHHES